MNPAYSEVLPFGSEDAGAFRDAFGLACSHIPCGVAVLAWNDPLEGPSGMTVSSLGFVSADPPLVSVSIDAKSKKLEQIRLSSDFAANLLSEEQSDVAALFAANGADRFKEVLWHADEGGLPILENTMGAFYCELRHEFQAGDHRIFIGEVSRLSVRGGRPLLHWRRAFHRLRVDYPFLESEPALEDFVHRWESGRLTKAEWTHGAHVGTAAYHAFDLDEEALFHHMKAHIIRHNEHVGTANTEDNGYHETLTRFWVTTISEFVKNGKFPSRFEAVKQAAKTFGQDRERHRFYYGFDVVRDRRARREWIKPDREPREQESIPTP